MQRPSPIARRAFAVGLFLLLAAPAASHAAKDGFLVRMAAYSAASRALNQMKDTYSKAGPTARSLFLRLTPADDGKRVYTGKVTQYKPAFVRNSTYGIEHKIEISVPTANMTGKQAWRVLFGAKVDGLRIESVESTPLKD